VGTSDEQPFPTFVVDATKTRLSGFFRERMMGLEPTTFCMASGSWVRSF